MIKWLYTTLFLWLISNFALANVFHDSNLDWKTIETAHFYFHFHQGEEQVVRNFIPTANKIHEQTIKFLNWTPQDKVHVVFTDEFDLSNGSATVFPRTNTQIFLAAPDDVFALEDHNGWLELVFRHEYLHIVHLDKARGAPLTVRKIFGRHPLFFPATFPNAFQPSWYIEGLATFYETDNKLGIGRGQSSYYNMLMRMELQGGLKPIRQINQPIGTWPSGSVPYLYGVHHYQFLKEKYGEKKIQALVEGLSDNIIPYRIDSNTKNVFGKDLDRLWLEFEKYLHEKFDPLHARIKSEGVREGKAISQHGYQAASLQALGDQVFYVAFDGKSPHSILRSVDGKTPEVLREVNFGTRLSLHKDKGLLLTQPERCRNARVYYDIYRMNLDGGDYERLTDCARYRFAVWSNKGDKIVAVKNELGKNSLHLLDENAKFIKLLWSGENGEQIGNLSYAPDKDQVVASVWRKDLGWNIERFDLEKTQWFSITNDKLLQSQPSYTKDGKSIIYIADDNGIFNVYQHHLASNKREKLTNVMGGTFNPALTDKGLYYLGYRPKGFDLFFMPMQPSAQNSKKLNLKFAANTDVTSDVQPALSEQPNSTTNTQLPVEQNESSSEDNQPVFDPRSELLINEQAKPASSSKNATPVTSEVEQAPKTKPPVAAKPIPPVLNQDDNLPAQDYSPWSSMAPNWWFPYLVVQDQRTELGFQTYNNDILYRHNYSLLLGYDVTNNWLNGAIDYIYDGLWPLIHIGIARDSDMYVNNNDDTIRIRSDESAIFEVITPFSTLDSLFTINVAALTSREKDAWLETGISPLADEKEDIAAIGLRYNSTDRYPLSVSRSAGRVLSLVYEDSDSFGNSDRKGQVTVGEWREFVHLGKEHVLALRAVEGHGRNNPKPFRLGGIQDFYADYGGIIYTPRALFNKRDYTLRGYDEGHVQLRGKNMRLLSLEYRFPLARIEHGWMVPPFGLNQLHGTVFYDTGGVWGDNASSPATYYDSVGVEFNTEMDIFYNLRLHLALGLVSGLDDVIGEDQVYLRIGHQF